MLFIVKFAWFDIFQRIFGDWLQALDYLELA